MSRVRNPETFRYHIREARGQYDLKVRPFYMRMHAKFKSEKKRPLEETTAYDDRFNECLEIQAREYLINNILRYLNWNPQWSLADDDPKITIESGIRVPSFKEKEIRFMDYYGFEKNDPELPLLIVEAKHPNQSLPEHNIRKKRVDYVTTIKMILEGEAINETWRGYLQDDLGVYVNTIKERTGRYPKRVMMTNGIWIIIFTDPEASFCGNKDIDEKYILVYEDPKTIDDNYEVIFKNLDYYHLCEDIPPIPPSKIKFLGDPSNIESVIRGILAMKNSILVKNNDHVLFHYLPVIFAHTKTDTWITVVNEDSIVKPRKGSYEKYFKDIDVFSEALLSDFRYHTGFQEKTVSLNEHFTNDEYFCKYPWVQETSPDISGKNTECRIITGQYSFFAKKTSAHRKCHHHKEINIERNKPSEFCDFISYWIDEGSAKIFCYCKEIISDKIETIKDPAQQVRCGHRGPPGYEPAFCKINMFETHICCRACIYEEICWNGELFKLKCKHGVRRCSLRRSLGMIVQKLSNTFKIIK